MTFKSEVQVQESRWKREALAIVALALGLATVIVAAAMLLSRPGELTGSLDVRWLLPSASVATVCAIASLLRREGTYLIPFAAIGLAAAGLVLGYVVIVGLVVLGAATLMAVLSQVL